MTQSSLDLIFTHEGEFTARYILRNGDPWFIAADACKQLDLGNSRQAVARLDADEKGVILADTPGGVQKVQIVNEAGLYSLILRSDKEAAKKFKRWITHEVLPSIRKTGHYGNHQKTNRFENGKKYHELRHAGYTHAQALEWFDRDTIGKEEFKRVCSEWCIRHGDIGRLANVSTRLVLHQTATAWKREHDTKESPRRYMSSGKKTALALVEGIAATLHRRRDSDGNEELERDVVDASQAVDWNKIAEMFPDEELPPPLPKARQHRLPAPPTVDTPEIGRAA